MDWDRRHQEIQGLLAAYCLGAVTMGEAAAVEEHTDECETCRAELARYEAATASLTGALDRMWARVSSTLAGRREDLDCFLAEVLAAGNERCDLGAPVRVLVAADTEAARVVLAGRLGSDNRFSVVGQAATPSELLAEGVGTLPDVVVLKLTTTDRQWLDAIGELTAWAPRTRLVAVSGVNARHLVDLMTTAPVVRSLATGRPSPAAVLARSDRSAPARPSVPTLDEPARPTAPRSIIQEVMRQVGVPVRPRP
jgi:hypothetical protein